MEKYILYNPTRKDYFTNTCEYSTKNINDAMKYDYILFHPDFECHLINISALMYKELASAHNTIYNEGDKL